MKKNSEALVDYKNNRVNKGNTMTSKTNASLFNHNFSELQFSDKKSFLNLENPNLAAQYNSGLSNSVSSSTQSSESAQSSRERSLDAIFYEGLRL